MFPDFIIIGASRAGTSWIMKALSEHPEACIPLKELHFFNRYWDKRDIDWYQSFFQNCEDKVKVEKSPKYLCCEKCAERIKKTIPEVKLIAILRDPIERAYSNFKMRVAAGTMTSDINKALALDSGIVREGLYFRHIQNYLNFFEKKDLSIFLYNDFRVDNTEFFKRFCRVIGVDDSFSPGVIDRKYNPSFTPPKYQKLAGFKNSMVHFLHRFQVGDRAIDFIKTTPLERFYYKMNDGGEFPVLSEEHRRKLASFYREDSEELQEWIGRDLSFWSVFDY